MTEGVRITTTERRFKSRGPSADRVQELVGGYKSRLENLLNGKISQDELARELAREFAVLEEQAIRDRVTGAFSRVMTETMMAEVALEEVMHGRRVGILMMDLDHFKKVNDDEGGHGKGDETLGEFARQVMAIVETRGGFVGRWGGEEFLAVVGDIGEEELERLGIEIGLKIRDAVAQGVKLKRERLTVSVGACFTQRVSIQKLEEGIRVGDRRRVNWANEEAIKRADGLLYRAKGKGGVDGRDRMVMEVGGGIVKVVSFGSAVVKEPVLW